MRFRRPLALFRQFFVDFLIERGEIGFADKGFQDFAFFVDEERGRVNLCAEGLGGGFVAVEHDGERQAVFADVLVHAFRRVYRLGDAEDLEVFAPIVFGHFDDQSLLTCRR